MNVTREAVMTALFALLSGATFAATSSGATAFVTMGRRIKLWTEVDQQPALFMTEHSEEAGHQTSSLPGKTTMSVDLFVYTKSGDSTVNIGSDLNRILDGIDAALKPDIATNRLTLGGLVHHCFVDGRIFKDPGDLDGQALAVIPIKILVP